MGVKIAPPALIPPYVPPGHKPAAASILLLNPFISAFLIGATAQVRFWREHFRYGQFGPVVSAGDLVPA